MFWLIQMKIIKVFNLKRGIFSLREHLRHIIETYNFSVSLL